MSQLEPVPKGRHYMASKERGVFEVEINQDFKVETESEDSYSKERHKENIVVFEEMEVVASCLEFVCWPVSHNKEQLW